MTHDGADPELTTASASTTPTGSADGMPELMAGFPPAPESQVTLANWQDPPFNRWAFRHMRELMTPSPTHTLFCTTGRSWRSGTTGA